MPNIIVIMLDLPSIGAEIAQRRKSLRLSQTTLARKARVSRATLEALENERAGELGFSKITRLLAALGLELKLQAASSHRPTLDELLQEDRDDKALDRRR
jgi:transcriptional regulator with XRE-family HTH domain